MAIEIDTSGFSCPQPVLMFLNAVKKEPEGEFDVLVDNDASMENVTRAASSRGFQIEQEKIDNNKVRLKIRRK